MYYMSGLSILVPTCPHRYKQIFNFLCFILKPALPILSAVDIKKNPVIRWSGRITLCCCRKESFSSTGWIKHPFSKFFFWMQIFLIFLAAILSHLFIFMSCTSLLFFQLISHHRLCFLDITTTWTTLCCSLSLSVIFQEPCVKFLEVLPWLRSQLVDITQQLIHPPHWITDCLQMINERLFY